MMSLPEAIATPFSITPELSPQNINSSTQKLDGMDTMFSIEVKDKSMHSNLVLISNPLKLLPKSSSSLDVITTSLLKTSQKILSLFTLDLTEIKELNMLMSSSQLQPTHKDQELMVILKIFSKHIRKSSNGLENS